jgi:hypothetical protein
MADTVRSDVDILALLTDNISGEISEQDLRDAYVTSRGKVIAAKTSAYTALVTDRVLTGDATSGAFTFTLPAIASAENQPLTFKKTDSSVNAITVDANGSETIDGATTQSLASQYDCITIMPGATEWHIIADNR